jgi:hypothetical protein
MDERELGVLGMDLASDRAEAAYEMMGSLVVTRIHLRYSKDALGDDLVFREAAPVEGGREGTGQDARPAPQNNYQQRYVVRHPWTGPVACDDPQYGRWGERQGVEPAKNLAFVARGALDLASTVREDVPAVGLHTAVPIVNRPERAAQAAKVAPSSSSGCGGCLLGRGAGERAALLVAAAVLTLAIRRRARRS